MTERSIGAKTRVDSVTRAGISFPPPFCPFSAFAASRLGPLLWSGGALTPISAVFLVFMFSCFSFLAAERFDFVPFFKRRGGGGGWGGTPIDRSSHLQSTKESNVLGLGERKKKRWIFSSFRGGILLLAVACLPSPSPKDSFIFPPLRSSDLLYRATHFKKCLGK